MIRRHCRNSLRIQCCYFTWSMFRAVMDRLAPLDKDGYLPNDDNSDENSENGESSSDEEFGEFLRDLADKIEKRDNIGHFKTTKSRKIVENLQNDEDDFEQDMEKELSSSFDNFLSKGQTAEDQRPGPSVEFSKKCVELNDDGTEEKGTNSDEEFYDKEEKSLKEHGKSNDDLFYDPNSDATDQKWLDNKKRRIYHNVKLPKSDAVLNCPCCMATLCFDCQRHEIYKTQYRAVFVENCSIDEDETLFVPESVQGDTAVKNKKSKKKAHSENNSRVLAPQPDVKPKEHELFKPVRCQKCKTQVAVLDSEEVYHFFNVLSSYT